MKHKYSVHIAWSAEDGAFVGVVPELAGCMADGQTHEAVLAKLDVVIDEWLETARERGGGLTRESPPAQDASVALEGYLAFSRPAA